MIIFKAKPLSVSALKSLFKKPYRCSYCGTFEEENQNAADGKFYALQVVQLDGNFYNQKMTNLVLVCKRCGAGSKLKDDIGFR